MSICQKCQLPLKSKKVDAAICKNCSHQTLPSKSKICEFCDSEFLDSSRSKNKKYCSQRCNTDAGHARSKDRILSGEVDKPKDSRDRRAQRRYRYNSDIKFKLSIALRTRLNAALKNDQKTGSAIKDLGCSVEDLKAYLESKFQPGMSWDNWSRDGWHIDHVVPLASFDLSNREQLLKACHYTNLQPLWANDNFSKSDKTCSHTVYILAGPNGCGKTTLASKLVDKFNVIDYDKNSLNACIELASADNEKPHLIVTPIQAKRISKILGSKGIKVILVYLCEPKAVIEERILSREGKITNTIDRRIARYESLKNKGLFDFHGTWNEVLDWLMNN
jgi:gluconate kinase